MGGWKVWVGGVRVGGWVGGQAPRGRALDECVTCTVRLRLLRGIEMVVSCVSLRRGARARGRVPYRFSLSSAVSIAQPRITQWLSGMALGSLMFITKLVEWPVVMSTPRRSMVRYSGHV